MLILNLKSITSATTLKIQKKRGTNQTLSTPKKENNKDQKEIDETENGQNR